MTSDVTVKHHSAAKLAIMQFASGGCAGFVEICLMHPLDVIKTRFQLSSRHASGEYSSLASTFRTMYRSEGIAGFYKGIVPPILAETPKRATKFLTFEQYKQLFTHFGGLPMPVVYSLAGLMSGCTEALVVNPFEVVKVKQQAEKGAYANQENAFASARAIYRKNGFGLKGLNKGLTATMCRHGIWNMCYFGFYHNIKVLLSSDGSEVSVPMRLLIGFTAGSLASVVNIPWDVAKSRIQGPQPVPGEIKYKSTVQTIKLVAREEGVMTLYRGLLPKILRLGPGGAVMLLVYEHMFDFFKRTL